MKDRFEQSPSESLSALRRELDCIDRDLLKRIDRRMAASKRIGTVKSRAGIPVMQPQRVREVLDDRSRIGARFGLDDKFVRKLFSLLVRESVRIQEEMLKNGASTRKPPSR